MPNGAHDLPTFTGGTPNPSGGQPELVGETPGVDQLENRAFRLARNHTITDHPKRRLSLPDCLQQQESLLRDGHHYFAEASEAQRIPSYASEWLLDNFYVVQQTLRQIRKNMPEGYYQQLPKLGSSSLEGHPRIYAIAREVIRYCDSNLNLEQVAHFVQVYQRITPLTMGELWALPTMLRIGIIECLTWAIMQATGIQADDEDSVSTWAPSFQEPVSEAIVGNCIVSLRALATQDWKAFFESTSRVDETLRRDPAEVYSRMDFDTRDRYRKVIEELARATDRNEEEVALEVVRLAERARHSPQIGASLSRISHIGFYLLDAGRPKLEARLNYYPPRDVRLRRWVLSHSIPVYLGNIGLFTLLIVLSVFWYALVTGGTTLQVIGASLLFTLPAVIVSVNLTNWIITHKLPPRMLPRLDFKEDIPDDCSTMVVIPALATETREIESLLHQLELHFLGNTHPRLYFALLTDFADAPQQHMPDDDALLEQLRLGIQALNEKHGKDESGPFYVFHRDRKWNPSEGTWMGWERKRGKLVEFNSLLLGSTTTSYSTAAGNHDTLPAIKYIITVDADTVLPRDSARRLIATLAHPLNKAEFDPGTGAIVTGYTVLQPRVEIKPTSADQSLFTRVFAGDATLDPYTRAVSDVYQDLFGEGIYVGKGIYDVETFERSLAGRVHENTLLSHDLFEGIQGRTGLVTDIILFEEYPPHFLAYARRLHRWVRGDWQLLPWLLSKVPHVGEGRIPNNLSLLDRWKILNNLFRSMLAPAMLLFLVTGWLWFPGSALVWTLVGVLPPAVPLILHIGSILAHGRRSISLRRDAPSLHIDAGRWLLELAFLPYETLLVLDAITSTLVRLTITRKRLLQWTSSAHTIRLFGKQRRLALLWTQMGGTLILALELALLVGLVNPAALAAAAPLLLLWLASLQIANWISRPVDHRQTPLSVNKHHQLRRLARRTWLYFEQFVGPDDNWLAPDHFQEKPRGLLVHSTSPTNLGLLLLSTLAAYDLGYVGMMDLVLRLESTLDSMARLERYRGHFLNWYDTRNLEPLPPRYVSTVDSGNLAGCLLALKQGCLDLPHDTLLRWERWQGLLDTIGVLSETIESLQGAGLDSAVAPLLALLSQIRQQILAAQDDPNSRAYLLTNLSENGRINLEQLLITLVESGSDALDAAVLRDLRLWSERVRHHLISAQSELDLLLPWFELLRQPPALFSQVQTDQAISGTWKALQDELLTTPRLDEVPEVCKRGQARLNQLQKLLTDRIGPSDHTCSEFATWMDEAHIWCNQLSEGLDSARMVAEGFLINCRDLGEQAEAYLQAMNFQFLFDPRRQVFHLGYNVGSDNLDPNHYDLLASEARLASLLAIAKGDVPQSHWLHLARPITRLDGVRPLLSWNGSMFEYLMPSLLMRTYKGTLLDQTCREVVRAQIAYGRHKNVPWGISEAGYYGFDDNLNYQYKGFGVPGLGFKRGLGDDLVISPYASLLALSLDPQAVVDNISRLIEHGMLGYYGFYEATDYTPSRQHLGQKSAIVQSYMVHHQGMILLSLTNYLQDEMMLRRFHADSRVQSTNLLLQEQVPQQVAAEAPHPEEISALRPIQPRPSLRPWHAPVDAPLPQAHFLSNGRYCLLITSAGSGYSRWQEMDLTRWRSDTTLDDWGTWVYVQDKDTGDLWSAGHQPCGFSSEKQDVLFYAHKAEFQRRDHDISLRMEITVHPADDVEIRRITLTNHSDRRRRLRLTSYAEVVLASSAADQRHPAFTKLFVESEFLPELSTLLFRRRPRSAKEKPIYLAHLLLTDGNNNVTSHESDRTRFLGRSRTIHSPEALTGDNPGLSGTTGATLDPIMALSQEIELDPHEKNQLVYITLASSSRQGALTLAHRYQTLSAVEEAFAQALSHSERELHRLDLTTLELEHIQQLLSVLLYPHAALRANPATLAANTKGQPGLWPYAISGDYPILLVRIGSDEETGLVSELLRAHAYWRNRQIMIDLVIINEREAGYDQELQGQLHRLLASTGADAWLNRRGGIFLLRADQLGETDRVLLETVARAILDGENGPLAEQLQGISQRRTHLPHFVPTLPRNAEAEPTPPLTRPDGLLFDNGMGGFSADGREYVIYLEPDQKTPAPWTNVIANPHFGFLVSESGLGYTWAENSGENRLTPWRNDPLADTPGEALYLRDEETGHIWSPTPLPAGAPAPYLIRHGAGYSVFEHHSHGLKQQLRLFAIPDAPTKVIQLRMENTWNRTRRISATYYAEWVLGTTHEAMQQYIVPEFDATNHALLCRNSYNTEFGERVAFLTATREPHGLTTDRTEFLGRMGNLNHPAALDRVGLAGVVEAGLDPCAAIQVLLWLAPGETKEVTFLLGQGTDRQDALRLVKQFKDIAQVESAWEAMTDSWDKVLGTITVQTPDPATDLLLNRWLLYQSLACRIWGRSALYQSSGAFGFRDQLQDVMSLSNAAPDVIRDHILLAARHQLEAGDVLHWWHPPSGRGVRTRCSDDLLWLPFVTAHYIATTGDLSILSEEVPFQRSVPLEEDELERYGLYETTDEVYPLYEHCLRALERGSTAGEYGLPLIGSHDWNDGMNRVGVEGQGQSVWLGWFLYATLTRFAPLCESRDDGERATTYRQRASDLRKALEANAWDGSWYRRAYYDDGTPLGSTQNDECQIDSIAQSWAVLSGAADPERAAQAMGAVADRLVRHDDQLILLFTPPFDKTTHDPGYIKGYLPGIRENGGQYTHAALWAVWAFAELGQGDRAEALFRLLNPIYHSDTPKKVERYRVEPYVVAADVYGVPPHTGRGGWTWYTGSASWMYRLGVEAILGLRRTGKTLQVNPCIPKHWQRYKMTYRYGSASYHIHVENPDGVNRGVKQATLDGVSLPENKIPLVNDGQNHEIHVLMGDFSISRATALTGLRTALSGSQNE